MDYLDYFGLNQEPFSMAPVNRFYFNSAQHSRALVRLMYAVDTMKGLAVLIGDIGTGKTTLARRMLDSLPEEEYESALLVIIHSGITADWLLERIALQLGVRHPDKEKLKLLSQLYKRLVELFEKGKKAVVLIDEAQMLQTRQIMEEFRGLLNLEMTERKLITFVFFGLPEIEDNLMLDQPLAQRVALKYRLEAFNKESTVGYVQHRMRLAGNSEEIFDPPAVEVVHHFARGIPRLINTICDNALFEGYLMRHKKIDSSLVMNVVSDLGLKFDDEDETGEKEPVVGTVEQSTDSAKSTLNQVQGAGGPGAEEAEGNDVQNVMDAFDSIITEEQQPQTEQSPRKARPKPQSPTDSEANDAELDSFFDELETK